MQDLQTIRITSHAEKRAQQRGIRLDTIDFVASRNDKRFRVHRGRLALCISTKRAASLLESGFAPSCVDRARGVVLITDPNRKMVVTVHHGFPRRPGKKKSRNKRSLSKRK